MELVAPDVSDGVGGTNVRTPAVKMDRVFAHGQLTSGSKSKNDQHGNDSDSELNATSKATNKEKKKVVKKTSLVYPSLGG